MLDACVAIALPVLALWWALFLWALIFPEERSDLTMNYASRTVEERVAIIARVGCVSLEKAAEIHAALENDEHAVPEKAAAPAPPADPNVRRIFASDSGKGHDASGK